MVIPKGIEAEVRVGAGPFVESVTSTHIGREVQKPSPQHEQARHPQSAWSVWGTPVEKS